MLDYLELDIEVSNTGMKTIESDNYREISRDDRNINGVLATMW